MSLVITPNQILEAVQTAAKTGSPHNAFRIRIPEGAPRMNGAKTVTYLTFQCNVLVEGARVWRDCFVRVSNLPTCSAAKPSQYNKVQTMFRVNSTCGTATVRQNVGEAFYVMNAAWMHHMAAVIASESVGIRGSTIHKMLQVGIGKPGEVKKKLDKEEQMWRVEIGFPQPKADPKSPKPAGQQQKVAPLDTATPTITIHDASRKVGKDFAEALDPATGKPWTYATLQNFITNGSQVSGVIDASSVTLSSMGCSIPLSWNTLIVKHVKAGREISTTDAFGDAIDEIEGGGDEVTSEPTPATPAPSAAAPSAAVLGIAGVEEGYDDGEDDGSQEGDDDDDDDDADPAPPAAAPVAAPKAAAAPKQRAKKP